MAEKRSMNAALSYTSNVNYLGNVLVTLTDKQRGIDAGSNGTLDYYLATVQTATHYYPFGWELVAMQYGAGYRYGYNGMEKSPEIGSGHHTTFFRENDNRIPRWWSVDPKTTAGESPYVMVGNSPIIGSDPNGDYCIPCIVFAGGLLIGLLNPLPAFSPGTQNPKADGEAFDNAKDQYNNVVGLLVMSPIARTSGTFKSSFGISVGAQATVTTLGHAARKGGVQNLEFSDVRHILGQIDFGDAAITGLAGSYASLGGTSRIALSYGENVLFAPLIDLTSNEGLRTSVLIGGEKSFSETTFDFMVGMISTQLDGLKELNLDKMAMKADYLKKIEIPSVLPKQKQIADIKESIELHKAIDRATDTKIFNFGKDIFENTKSSTIKDIHEKYGEHDCQDC